MSDKGIMLPRDAGRFIAEHSLDVKISQDGIEKTAKKASTILFLFPLKAYWLVTRKVM